MIVDICADCDALYDYKGCAAGLVCGSNNCAKYHLVGPTTGINHGSDCCERKFGKYVMIWARWMYVAAAVALVFKFRFHSMDISHNGRCHCCFNCHPNHTLLSFTISPPFPIAKDGFVPITMSPIGGKPNSHLPQPKPPGTHAILEPFNSHIPQIQSCCRMNSAYKMQPYAKYWIFSNNEHGGNFAH